MILQNKRVSKVMGMLTTVAFLNLHTENTLCYIALLPLGEGFVDVQDFTFLAEHLFEEIIPVETIE